MKLARTLAINDFKAKHARSILGLLWLVLTPVGILLVYWSVFSYVLEISWPGENSTNIGFVLPFFIGYSLFMFFSDVVTSSLGLFVSKRNYVKKSPFSLWVLWLANFYRALMQASAYIFLIFIIALWQKYLSINGVILFFLFLAGSLIFIAAVSIFFAALGPFFNDLSEASRVILRVMFYASPVTYPLSIVPPDMLSILWWSPLTNIIVPIRNALIFSSFPNGNQYLYFMCISIILLGLSYWFFNRAGEAIIDVI